MMTSKPAGDRGNVVSWDEHNNTFPLTITDSQASLVTAYGKNLSVGDSLQQKLFSRVKCSPSFRSLKCI